MNYVGEFNKALIAEETRPALRLGLYERMLVFNLLACVLFWIYDLLLLAVKLLGLNVVETLRCVQGGTTISNGKCAHY